MEIFPDNLQKVEFAISRHMNVSVQQIRGHDRIREFVQARHAVWAVARYYLQYTFPRLARLYRRDHTTVMYGIRKTHGTIIEEKALEYVEKEFPGLLKMVEQPVDNGGDSGALPGA